MASMMGGSTGGKIEFDDDGNIIESESSSKSYSCKEFESSAGATGGFDMMAMMSGQQTAMSDMIGGVGRKVADLTMRATKAVVEVDMSMDATEIAINTGKFETGSDMNYAQITNCQQYLITDLTSYTNCVMSAIQSQIAAYAQIVAGGGSTDSPILHELSASIAETLDLLNGGSYIHYSRCKVPSSGNEYYDSFGGTAKTSSGGTLRTGNICKSNEGGINCVPICCQTTTRNDKGQISGLIHEINAARQCAINLTTRFNNVKTEMEKEKKQDQYGGGGYGGGMIQILAVDKGYVDFQDQHGRNSKPIQQFITRYCPNNTSFSGGDTNIRATITCTDYSGEFNTNGFNRCCPQNTGRR
jgi:hypothetical protein